MVDYSSARLKVERAKAHIAEVERQVADFGDLNPYRMVKKVDLKNETSTIAVSIRRALPASLSTVIGDAIHNLRSALDHAICATVSAQNRTIRDTKFPFSKAEADVEASIKACARKALPSAKEVCRAAEAYPGGNDNLVALHELDLIDKHQLIIALTATGAFSQRYIERDGKPEQRVTDRITYLGTEEQIIPVPSGRERDIPFEVGVTVEVVFGPDAPLAGEPVVRSLKELAVAVERVLDLFHTICP